MAVKEKTYLLFGQRVSEESRQAIQAQLGLEEIPVDFGPFNSGATHCELFPFLKDERKGKTPEERAQRLQTYKNMLLGSHVIVVESTGEQPNVADSIERVRSAVATLKRNGVAEVTVAMPNAAYDRQDRGFEEEGRLCSVNAEWFARDLKSRGVDRVITLTPHSKDTSKYWEEALGKGNYHGIDTAQLFVEDMRAHFAETRDVVVGAPDGANKPNDNGQARARHVASLLQGVAPEEADKHLFKISKEHTGASETQLKSFEGDVAGKDCVIVDDMADGGSTLINAAKKLREQGARSVAAYITHAICSDPALDSDDPHYAIKVAIAGVKSMQRTLHEDVPENFIQDSLKTLTAQLPETDQYQDSLGRLMQRQADGSPLIDRLVTTDSIPEIYEKRKLLPERDQERVAILTAGPLLANQISQIIDNPRSFASRLGAQGAGTEIS